MNACEGAETHAALKSRAEGEAHISWSMVTCQGSTRLQLCGGYWPCAGGLSAVNDIGTQLRAQVTWDRSDGVWRYK